MYFCALRVSEALDLQKGDFNIKRKVLLVRNAKTGKNQKTTITPNIVAELENFLSSKSDTVKIFPITRQTVWRYCKQAGEIAGLDLFEEQKKREIEGAWTHLFRKSYAKWMLEKGGSIPLIQVKLRHAFRQSVDHYIKSDINALLSWEASKF